MSMTRGVKNTPSNISKVKQTPKNSLAELNKEYTKNYGKQFTDEVFVGKQQSL